MAEQLYDSLADWWPVISPPSEYAEEAALYVEMIRGAARRPVREALELGSGGGNNASHMKHAFALTLVEPSDRMRKLSLALNPECEHVPDDMRTVRLGRAFDAVFVHDAVMYMTTEDDLRAALATVAAHLAPGGVALVTVPGITRVCREEAEAWGDYWRFTAQSAARLFEEAFGPAAVEVETHGNVLAATAQLHGIAADELDPGALDVHDPDFEVLIGVRAQAPSSASTA